MAFNFTKEVLMTRISNAEAAAATDITCTTVDMLGYDSVTFVVLTGVLTTGGTTGLHVNTSSDNSSFNAILGSGITITDSQDQKMIVCEIVNPRERYLQLIVDRADANAVIDGVIAFQYNAKQTPVTQSSTVVTPELHFAPAEGSA